MYSDGVTAKAAGIPYQVKGQNWLKKWIDFNRAIHTDPEGEVGYFMKNIWRGKYVQGVYSPSKGFMVWIDAFTGDYVTTVPATSKQLLLLAIRYIE